jgi:hypothetical protein
MENGTTITESPPIESGMKTATTAKSERLPVTAERMRSLTMAAQALGLSLTTATQATKGPAEKLEKVPPAESPATN